MIVNETKLKTSVNNPLISISAELLECNNWSLEVGDIILKTDNSENYFKTLAFMRIIGYLITDGYISYNKEKNSLCSGIFLGHIIDVQSALNDIRMFIEIKERKWEYRNLYKINMPNKFMRNIIKLKGIITGKRSTQPALLPEFLLDANCPRPIIREFLGGLFGGDGHTCILALHRGKRDILTSISFSQTKTYEYLNSLNKMFEDIQKLLKKCGINKTNIQKFKETSFSKIYNTNKGNKSYQLTLHLDMEELIPFYEKIGFRYCCHKSQRLDAAVSYKRLRNEVVRQHNWLVNKVDEITNFSKIKKENPNKNVPTKKAIEQAVNELKSKEALVHEYSIPSTHDITDHLIKGTQFGKFTSKAFPTAEEYLKEIGALDWFLSEENFDKDKYYNESDIEIDTDQDNDEDNDEIENISDNNIHKVSYGVNRNCHGLPTFNLKVIDIRPAGVHPVYDIEVENTHSFLANGVVAHNCMVSHGASRFTRGRMYDASDKYQAYICKKCGLIASYNDELHIHHCRTCDNRVDFAYVEIPYACKLLFQELITMNVVPRVITDH